MADKKKERSKEKPGLHPRNKHRERYDFQLLIKQCPALAAFVKINTYGDESIDFFNPDAVKMLNKALLITYYGIAYWDIPKGYLCPPIPGRADYIHHVADLLGYKTNSKTIKEGRKIICLDIGVGANCIYPLIGNKEYGWSFIGSDIDPVAIRAAKKIIDANPSLKGAIDLRLQQQVADIFNGIIQPGEQIDVTICNPPFHASANAAQKGTIRKLNNLKQQKNATPVLNFGGHSNELWCKGGEEKFICDMIVQSKQFTDSCYWFTTLVSKQSSLQKIHEQLKQVNAVVVKIIPMVHGNKISRIMAWTFRE